MEMRIRTLHVEGKVTEGRVDRVGTGQEELGMPELAVEASSGGMGGTRGLHEESPCVRKPAPVQHGPRLGGGGAEAVQGIAAGFLSAGAGMGTV